MSEIRPDLAARNGAQPFDDVAIGVVQIAEAERTAGIRPARLDTRRAAVVIHAMYAEGAALYGAFAARRVRLLATERLVDERTGVEGTRHHAVATADADVLVDEHDAVVAAKRRAGRAHVHARRALAVLTQQRQRERPARRRIVDVGFADPLRIGFGTTEALETVLVIAGIDARRTALGAPRRINQHAPAHRAADGLRLGLGDHQIDEPNPGGERHERGADTDAGSP